MRWLLALFAAFPLLAHGGVVAINFDNPDSWFSERGNFAVGGLRFSPFCRYSSQLGHADISPSGSYLASEQDNSNCDEFSEVYLGPATAFGPDYYVDRFGGTFTLLGLAGLGYDGITDFTVRSSRGGSFDGHVRDPVNPVGYGAFTFTGPEWTDITWFTLHNHEHYHQSHHGWDDIRYSYNVSEPPLWSLLLAAGAIGFRRRFPKLFHPRKGE